MDQRAGVAVQGSPDRVSVDSLSSPIGLSRTRGVVKWIPSRLRYTVANEEARQGQELAGHNSGVRRINLGGDMVRQCEGASADRCDAM